MNHFCRGPFHILFLLCLVLGPFSQAQVALPADYDIDLRLGLTQDANFLEGAAELKGTPFNETGERVFRDLIASGYSLPFPWQLKLVNTPTINAASNAGGRVYVYRGMIDQLGESRGLWAAVLSHEVSHTGLRHQVRTYLQRAYNQQMIHYYRMRIANGDESANWALIAFQIAAPIAMGKMMREQEHQADSNGMLLMARAGYHPDFVFALHHMLEASTGEQSKFAAFFSDHPRWETRDQRSAKLYQDALAEFTRRWPQAELSPGGRPPVVAFLGKISAIENKREKTADISVPLSCHNATDPVRVVMLFEKDRQPVKANDPAWADKNGNLLFSSTLKCSDNDVPPAAFRLPAAAVNKADRKLKAFLVVFDSENHLLDQSKKFDVRFPKTH